jgi:dipicolinate synthase subunit A
VKTTYGIIGGDLRQAYLSELLAQEGKSVRTYGLAAWSKAREAALRETAEADVILLPLPLCKEEGRLNCAEGLLSTAELFALFLPEQMLFAGQVKPQQRQEAQARGLTLTDYFQREELVVANVVPTVEGALQIAMEQLPETLCGMDCLVVGYGRIGKLLAHRLSGLGARVAVSARKPGDLAWIRAFGWKPLRTDALAGRLDSFGVVFNTVPAPVLGPELLAQLPSGCLCIDVASRQGIDLAAAEKRGLTAVWARSLPGRMAPRTAAAAIRDTVTQILEERGEPD